MGLLNLGILNSDSDMVQIEILKSYSYLLINLKSNEFTNYVYSQSEFNEILKFPFNFENDDIEFYFINFAKSIMMRFHLYPFEIFYNQVY